MSKKKKKQKKVKIKAYKRKEEKSVSTEKINELAKKPENNLFFKFELKDRFKLLIKTEKDVQSKINEIKAIEGQEYIEFEAFPGVYFSKKLFC